MQCDKNSESNLPISCESYGSIKALLDMAQVKDLTTLEADEGWHFGIANS